MKATPLEFRFRVVIVVLLYILGFWAPWTRYGDVAPDTTAWLALSAIIARWRLLPLQTATQVVTLAAILLAFAGAALRIWGTAYLGASVVHAGSMKAGGVMASGPYRYLRNPLYLGTWLLSLAVSILMPPSGAIVFLVALGLFYLRLILGEESYLTQQLGEPYLEYRRRVPRLFPSLRPRVDAAAATPHWIEGVLAEVYALGYAFCLTALAWRYDPRLLIRCLIICFGLSVVSRALLPKSAAPSHP